MCIGARKRDTTGNPDPKYIGTPCAETSEPHDADAHAPLHAAGKRVLKEDRKPRVRRRAAFDVLQFHQTPKVSPATAAGVTDRLWEMADVVDMLDAL